ncbi:MAG: NADH-quinone oxidoreductase subunit NuoH [Phycisphaerae bacterium]
MSQFTVPWVLKRGVHYGFPVSLIVRLSKVVYEVARPLLSRFPGAVMLSAVAAMCLIVWGHAVLFRYVDSQILERAAAAGVQAEPLSYTAPLTWGLPPSTIRVLIDADAGVASSFSGVLQYALWPLQFGLLRDVLALIAIVTFFNLFPAYAIWWERKVAGRIQSRLGPMRVGGWHGWAQSPADGIKLVLKEDLIPQVADAPLFRLAPYLVIMPVVAAFLALPFGAAYVFRDLDIALLFILAMLGVEVIGVIVAGWASNNKWSVYGAMREACQMVSYEIPMGMALLVPIVCAGSLNLRVIGEAQSDGWFSWLAFNNPFCFAAFVAYFMASLASCKRAPFDLPESESELVAGFLTEYSGFRWALFFFAEYAAMFVVAGLAVILFLGAWNSPLPASWGSSWGDGLAAQGLRGVLLGGPVWFITKAVFIVYVQMWLRWTLPRIRIDQVLYACVQVLLPLTMLFLLGTVLWVWASTSGNATWSVIDGVTRWVLGLIGAVFALGFPAIAVYGFYQRRRLVGNLAVDAMPGS